MCKILIVPKITKQTRPAALKFMEKMKPLMSLGNRDGLGYSAIDSQGNLFGERWHTNEDSYVKQKPPFEDKGSFLKDMGKAVSFYSPKAATASHNSFGTVNLSDMTALTMHTRMATSGREFKNTHPFHYPEADTALIHNGVIDNVSDFKFKVSTCDSESILISYLNKGVNENIANMQQAADALKGYYACGVFSRDAAGERILDIFKGNNAWLYASYIKELDTVVFCTSRSDIEEACKSLGFSLGSIYDLDDGFILRFKGGEVIERKTFTPKSRWTNYERWTTPQTKQEEKKTPMTKEVLTKEMSNYLHLIPGLEV